MAELEDELKTQNWLSVLTFDAFKYEASGGEVVIEQRGNTLFIGLVNVDLETVGINRKFTRRFSEPIVAPI